MTSNVKTATALRACADETHSYGDLLLWHFAVDYELVGQQRRRHQLTDRCIDKLGYMQVFSVARTALTKKHGQVN